MVWGRKSKKELAAIGANPDYGLAAGNLTRPPIRKETLAIVRSYVRSHDRRRWERMRRDHAWLKGMAGAVGMHPEDARWLYE